jgi:hypothetical protein
VVPVFPPLALALGHRLDLLLSRAGRRTSWAELLRRGSPLAARACRLVLVCVVVGGIAAAAGRLTSPWLGVAPALAATAALTATLRRRALPWSACAAVTFVALWGAVWVILPAYNDRFALRDALRTEGGPPAGEPVRVVCYPQRFDSVRFYLPDAVTEAYTTQERARLVRRLEHGGDTLLVVRSGRPLAELLDELPESLEFVPRQSGGAFAVGWVRPRALPQHGATGGKSTMSAVAAVDSRQDVR